MRVELACDTAAPWLSQVLRAQRVAKRILPVTPNKPRVWYVWPTELVRARALPQVPRFLMPCIAYPLPSPEAGAQVRYVRRAVELAGDLAVPGLSRECRAYVTSHPSNAYDGPALRVFARGLLAAGQRDRAAAVYCGLLRVRLPALHALTGFRVRSIGAAMRLQPIVAC